MVRVTVLKKAMEPTNLYDRCPSCDTILPKNYRAKECCYCGACLPCLRFGAGATHFLLVCNLCHGEVEVGEVVPYQAKCPNGCGMAKTDHRFSMVFTKNPVLHRMVAISTNSKNYAIYQHWKEKNGKEKQQT